ncbi:ATP-NAD kinase [Rickenella mellea]|uniref:ATP-NAD kinase n=1 Tax=Rickenella mellea TaxID=50990 RepID=A0A4Y7QG06_9AGAM|nr:ATP-NAD kinase [Rickenella mellea]
MRPGADSEIGVAKALENPQPASNKSTNFSDFTFSSGSSASSPSEVEDDDDVSSLTRQLAETAVSVREMSKQLGRARVRTNIQNVLIITKARDNRLIKLTRELAVYLMNKRRNGGRGLVVYVDHQLRYSKRFDAAGLEREYPDLFVPLPRRRSSSSTSLSSMASGGAKDEFAMMDEGQLRYWTSDMCSRTPHLFDFVVTLGGDGTVLFTSWLFQRIVPPVLPFALGSLGFLTNFDFADYQAAMDTVIDSGIRVNLRMRFTCTVYRAVAPEKGKGRRAVKKGDTGEIMMKNLEKGGWEALEGGWSGTGAGERDRDARCHKDKEIMCFTTRPVESFEVLNDLVVDRGPSPYVSLLELFGDEHHMTTVQADGLTVSTPTGSTAYSLSAGGSLVHPEIPAILITPICPHTLSFRPMLLPDSMELRICVPFNSRSTAWASFDGRGRVELKQGDHIKVTASKFPFPTVCADKQSTDWFHAISRTLKWNERERQKSFVVVEEGAARPKRRKHEQATAAVNGIKKPEAVEEELQEDDEEDEVSDQEEEEEKFDIDDSSPEANGTAETVETVAHEKAMAEEAARARPTARDAAIALSKGNPLLRNNRSRSRGGIDSPGRFAGPHPHPPQVSPRHVSFKRAMAVAEHVSASSSTDSLPMHEAQKGDRDHIHSPQLLSGGRSRIPRDRDVDAESMKTPTPTDATHGSTRRPHSHSAMHDGSTRRAFAVWGHDESDSNASDSDV